MTAQLDRPVVYTKAEAAAAYHVSVRTIERWMTRGLRYSGGGESGDLVLIRPEWIDAYLERRGRDD